MLIGYAPRSAGTNDFFQRRQRVSHLGFRVLIAGCSFFLRPSRTGFTFFVSVLKVFGMPAYFTEDLFRFLKRLKRNNDREWFQAHREDYDNFACRPALRFITDFAQPLNQISPYLVADPRSSRGSLFRIYRD